MKTYSWGLDNENVETSIYATVFSKEECNTIINYGKTLEPIDGALDNKKIDNNIRKCNIAWIPDEKHSRWIFQRCTSVITEINQRFFKFDIQKIQALQFTVYDDHGSFYGKHLDMSPSAGTSEHRKLSFSIQLSSPEDYKGGELQLYYKSTCDIAKKDQGIVTFFPSYCLHEVTPVTSGIRYALVGWVVGPRFK